MLDLLFELFLLDWYLFVLVFFFNVCSFVFFLVKNEGDDIVVCVGFFWFCLVVFLMFLILVMFFSKFFCFLDILFMDSWCFSFIFVIDFCIFFFIYWLMCLVKLLVMDLFCGGLRRVKLVMFFFGSFFF